MKSDKVMIEFTKEKLERFKKYYEACDKETFTFEGNEYVKGYAKYMIEHIEVQIS